MDFIWGFMWISPIDQNILMGGMATPNCVCVCAHMCVRARMCVRVRARACGGWAWGRAWILDEKKEGRKRKEKNELGHIGEESVWAFTLHSWNLTPLYQLKEVKGTRTLCGVSVSEWEWNRCLSFCKYKIYLYKSTDWSTVLCWGLHFIQMLCSS